MAFLSGDIIVDNQTAAGNFPPQVGQGRSDPGPQLGSAQVGEGDIRSQPDFASQEIGFPPIEFEPVSCQTVPPVLRTPEASHSSPGSWGRLVQDWAERWLAEAAQQAIKRTAERRLTERWHMERCLTQ